MKMIFHIVIKTGLAAIMLMIVLMTSAFPVQADDPDENTLAIIELINQIRLDPLTYAEGLGYDRQTLLTDLPWLGDYALGIEALTVQDFLNQRAFALNSDDPLTEEPVPTLDTDFAFTGDIGGVVAFINFMDPATAIEIVVNNQLASELDPLYEGIRYILSSVYSYLGADFRSGRTMYKSGSRNAYYISITFGSSRLTSEVQVVNMINQMRAMPFKTYEALSLDTTFLPGNFSPLFFNEPLSLTAAAGLYSEIDFSAYAAYYGFQGAGVEGSSIIESFPEADSDLHALWTFYSLILNEMKTYPDKNTIFHSLYNGIGSALYYVNADSHHDIKLTIAAGLALTQDQDRGFSSIYGVAFIDTDGNGIYTPGEGAPDRLITAYDTVSLVKTATAITNNAGQFVMNLPENADYTIQTGTQEALSEKKINLRSDQYVDLIVQ